MKKLLFILGLILITEFSFGQWTTDYFVDEFGDKTDKVLISQKCLGTFSNSATFDSELTVDLIFYYESSAPMLRFNLYEYNKGPIVKSSSNGSLKIKTSGGKVYSFNTWGGMTVFLRNEDDPIYNMYSSLSDKKRKKVEESDKRAGIIQNDNPSVLLELLKNETLPLKFFISVQDGSTYNFTVNPKGFTETYNILL